jgi:ribosome biogenesis protein BMS1
VKGPITVVTGKKQRHTFIECPNNLAGMLDVAKVADLVLLLVDASFGFEMVTLLLFFKKKHNFLFLFFKKSSAQVKYISQHIYLCL